MKSIRTILACIRKADQKYNLINHGDKIVLGLSGGKDSVALLYALSLYQKFSHTDFELQPVTLDLGFPNFDPKPMEEFCEKIGYKLIVTDSKEVYPILLANQKGHSHLPCSICSKMKKAAINKVAKELGFNKVAFAHHADDAIETLFMNEMYGGRIATFSPKMHLERADITFIRPFILVRENEISRLVKEENLPVTGSACPADKETTREDIKIMLNDIYKKFPSSKENFLSMLDNYEKKDIWDKELSYQINQSGLILVPVTTIKQYQIIQDIRTKVFIEEQNCPIEEEFVLNEEKEAYSFIIAKDEIPVGTIRYRIINNDYKIERFCVLNKYRGKQYGKEAILFLLNMIKEKSNPCRVYIHAQYQLKDYYSSIGFKENGSVFIEAGIKHILMELFY